MADSISNKTHFPSVRLETSGGELVHMGRMMPFNKPPDVILWGFRVFKLHEAAAFEEVTKAEPGEEAATDMENHMLARAPVVYRECFAYYLVDV